MPSASSRANSSAQPGSSTITGSPARSSVRLTMSSAWVAPMVVTICSGDGRHVDAHQLLRQAAPQAHVAGRLAVLQRQLLQRGRAGHAPHGGGHEGRRHPVRRKHAHARLRLVARAVEHAADERAGIGRHARGHHLHGHGGRHAAHTSHPAGPALLPERRVLCRRRIAHIEAALPARLDQPLRQQLVVGGHHRVRAHALLPRAFAHRGQARAGRQQPGADALGQAVGQLAVSDWVEVRVSMRRALSRQAPALEAALCRRRDQYRFPIVRLSVLEL
jgi:hypothetical protein